MAYEKLSIEELAVTDGAAFRLAERDPAWVGPAELTALGKDKLKKRARKFLRRQRKELARLQERLYADDRYSVLLIFQGRDAAGKDGTIKHVMRGVNPQGCQVFSFKVPSKEELDHNYMWRCWKALPERGRIGIFNRSYYEEVLVVRIHPEILKNQRLPHVPEGERIWQERFEDINAFERHMARNGTVILKFFLNVSAEEQRRRFLERLENPEKHWKFSMRDLEERKFWDAYSHAAEDMLRNTSTPWAPWYVIPADHKWAMRALVGHVITERLGALDLRTPELDDEARAALERARTLLRAEEETTPQERKTKKRKKSTKVKAKPNAKAKAKPKASVKAAS